MSTSWVSDSLPSFAKNLHILLLDHDSVSLDHLASLLKQQSYNVSMARLARVALSMIQEKGSRFDLVMANISILDMDSFSFLHVLLKMNIAVIFMSPGTGAMNLNIATKALEEGACYFLQKPITKDDLKYVWQHVYRIRNNKKNKSTFDNYNHRESMNSSSNHNNNKQNFGGNNTLIFDDDERRNKYYFSSKSSRTRVVWNSERRRKFTDALAKLGDQSRPKLILKLMNEPCLTVRQVANHLQKYKAQLETFKWRRDNKLSYKREIPNNGGLMRPAVLGGEKFRPIAPKTTVVNPESPVVSSNNFVNHNFQQFEPNISYNYQEEWSGFQSTLSHEEFNEFPNETHYQQQLDYNDLSCLNIIDQEQMQMQIQMQMQMQMQEEVVPVEADAAASSGNEGNNDLGLTEYDYLFNLMELELDNNDDSFNNLMISTTDDDLNLSDQVDQYSEWLSETTVLENPTVPDNFLLGNTQQYVQNYVGDVDVDLVENEMIGRY